MNLDLNNVLSAVYDLKYNPITFDFAVFLGVVEQNRIFLKASSIHLWIVTGEYRKKSLRDNFLSEDQKDWRVEHILIPLARRLPSITQISIVPNLETRPTGYVLPLEFPVQRVAPYVAAITNELFTKKISPICFEPSCHALDIVRNLFQNKEIVSITIRDSEIFKHRNTSYEEIIKMVNGFIDLGIQPIIIPDHDSFLIRRFPSELWPYLYPDAALDLDLRMAVASFSIMNFGPSNGPVASLFLTKGVKIFQYDLLKSDHTGLGAVKGWEITNGFAVGQTFPWAENGSRLRWIDYTAENVLSDFSNLFNLSGV
jgi:hypothetical protein